MTSLENIDSTILEFKGEVENWMSEKMQSTKNEFSDWLEIKLRDILNENLEFIRGYDNQFYKVRDERDRALLREKFKEPHGRFKARLAERGGSLKKRIKKFKKNRTLKNKN